MTETLTRNRLAGPEYGHGAPKAACPKCGGTVVGNKDDATCINCGYVPADPNRDYGEPEQTVDTIIESADQLGAAALARLRSISGDLAKMERLIEEARNEARKFLAIADLCEVQVPDALRELAGKRAKKKSPTGDYACEWCGKRFNSPHFSRHKGACPARPEGANA